jgi:hypothetical protein
MASPSSLRSGRFRTRVGPAPGVGADEIVRVSWRDLRPFCVAPAVVRGPSQRGPRNRLKIVTPARFGPFWVRFVPPRTRVCVAAPRCGVCVDNTTLRFARTLAGATGVDPWVYTPRHPDPVLSLSWASCSTKRQSPAVERFRMEGGPIGNDEMAQRRSAATAAIVDSQADKKLVVAGPGTGKTHTFKCTSIRWRGLSGSSTTTRLRCLRGIDTLTALALVAEIGDFARFKTAGSSWRSSAWCPRSAPPASNAGRARSPRSATRTCAASWSSRPGTRGGGRPSATSWAAANAAKTRP